jgi:DNA-binding NarL/FixJ family response regulator
MKSAVHEPVKVFLVDDHPLLRTGLRFTLDGMQDLDLIGEASDGFEGVEKILKDPPDIALIDIDLPGISGITVIEMVKKKLRNIKIIALSSYSEKSYVSGAMEAGADGYMLKAISITALVDFLREFARGENPVSPYLLDMAGSAGAEEESEPVHITPREEQILNLIAGGKSNKQISSELFLSIETVKTHIKKIFTKLEVKSRLEAVAVARNLKIIE